MLGKDVYRFAGVYQFSEVTDKGRLFRRIAEGVRWTRAEDEEFPSKIEPFNSQKAPEDS